MNPSDENGAARPPRKPEASEAMARTMLVKKAAAPWIEALQRMMQPSSNHNVVQWMLRDLCDLTSIDTPEKIATMLRSDVIVVEFGEDVSNGPENISIAKFNRNGVEVFRDCELWRFKPWMAAELIAPARRFKIEVTGGLKGRPNNLDEMRARRVARTKADWAKLAQELSTIDFSERWQSPQTVCSPEDGKR